MDGGNKFDFERMFKMQKALEEAFVTAKIQEAAGNSEIRKAPITGPDWPQRADYPNRAAFRRACAEWRKGQ
ncbi:hypothetical protein ACQKO5_18935 [Novosphingobium subterraneum]|uniref:hypothetical protein n=1 Tax=Novosphingobium subterraneum TaxID=48936 RepID=UPI003CFBF7A8